VAILTLTVFLIWRALDRWPRWHQVQGHRVRWRMFAPQWMELRCDDCGATWLKAS
jgi:hypothetical protein